MNFRSGSPAVRYSPLTTPVGIALREELFHRMIAIERRRLQRSSKSVVLMLIDLGQASGQANIPAVQDVLLALTKVTRETDITGWYKEARILGVMLTDVDLGCNNAMFSSITARVTNALQRNLPRGEQTRLNISYERLADGTESDSEPKPLAASVDVAKAARAAQGGRKWAL